MIRVGKVVNTHRYTKERNVLYEGNLIEHAYSDYVSYLYREQDGTKVTMCMYEDHMTINRKAEVETFLTLVPKKSTENPVTSSFGTFGIEVYTYKYEKTQEGYCVSYDVENGMDDKDGFIIELILEGEHYEFH